MHIRPTLTALLALALPLAACSDGKNNTGDDTPDERPDRDPDPSAERATTNGFLVQSDISAAVEVRGYTTHEDGSVSDEADSSGSVNADGSFTLDVAADETLYVIQALDANGQVVGQAMLESTGQADGSTETTPIDQQSTVEAATFLEAIAQAGDRDACSYGDLRGRIDATLASDVYAAWQSDGARAELEALAAATLSAQQAELWSYTDAGATTDADAVAEDELNASAALSSSLYAWIASGNDEPTNAPDAEAMFLDDLYLYATSDLGLTAQETAESNANSTLAFVAVVEAMLGESDGTSEAALVAAGDLQAWMSANATEDTYAGSGANSSIMADVSASTAAFVERADDADDANAMTSAWADFYAEVVAGSDSTLTSVFNLGVTEELAFESALDDAEFARGELLASVRSSATSEASSGFDWTGGSASSGSASAEAMAQAVVDARSTYNADVWSACSGVTALTAADVDLMASLVTSVHGAYAFGY